MSQWVINERGLDQIDVSFWNGQNKGAGGVTIECYDMAWKAYWGAMGDSQTIDFFLSCDPGYITDRLTSGQFYSRAKAHDVYVNRIVTAIQKHLREKTAQYLGG